MQGEADDYLAAEVDGAESVGSDDLLGTGWEWRIW